MVGGELKVGVVAVESERKAEVVWLAAKWTGWLLSAPSSFQALDLRALKLEEIQVGARRVGKPVGEHLRGV